MNVTYQNMNVTYRLNPLTRSQAMGVTGCSLLLADALFPSADWSEKKPHLSAGLAAELAREAEVKKLVLTHLSPLFSPALLLREAQARFSDVRLASSGTVLEV